MATLKDPSLTTVLEHRPLVVETRPEALRGGDPTPVDSVFVRNNLDVPEAGMQGWEVEVAGTTRPARVGLDEIFTSLPRHSVRMVLQCAGNGRRHLGGGVPGVQWERGGMACVEWSGVRLADLVSAYGGPTADAAYVTVLGRDADPDDPRRVERSVPLRAGLADGLLADRMNGLPVPEVHGGPIRFVLPGFYAVNSVKWVRRVALTALETDADIQRSRYRLVPPGEDPGRQHPPVWRMRPVSHILEVRADGGDVTVSGVAFSGGEAVEAVELTTDRVTWSPARLEPQPDRFAWCRFRGTLPPGTTWVASRCRTASAAQPRNTLANREGYAVDGWEDLSVRVGDPAETV